jgi:N4-gp56 family major capsid protein
MAESTARTGLTPQKWDSNYFLEYTRKNKFRRYMGTDTDSVIYTAEDLAKGPGDRITFAAARALGGGVTGNTVLEGNEAELDLRGMAVTIRPVRNAVVVTEWDEQKSVIDIRDVARPALRVWSDEKMREDVITALKSVPNTAGVMTPYELATAAERNAWLVANADRVLFGSSVANGSSGVVATALLTVDATNDKLTAAVVSLAKRRAQMATPRITPTRRVDDDQEWYVMWCNPLSFRDLRADPVMANALQEARERGVNNPLFTGGDLLWDGVIIREIAEMGLPVSATTTRLGQTGGVLAGVGASGINVGFNFLCGAGALRN